MEQKDKEEFKKMVFALAENNTFHDKMTMGAELISFIDNYDRGRL